MAAFAMRALRTTPTGHYSPVAVNLAVKTFDGSILRRIEPSLVRFNAGFEW